LKFEGNVPVFAEDCIDGKQCICRLNRK
jgi:hypothetical protein